MYLVHLRLFQLLTYIEIVCNYSEYPVFAAQSVPSDRALSHLHKLSSLVRQASIKANDLRVVLTKYDLFATEKHAGKLISNPIFKKSTS